MRSPYETDDEERTTPGRSGGRAPTYEEAPSTLEVHPAHSIATAPPGMPAPVVMDPVIRQGPVLEPRELDPAGPTDPEGHPMLGRMDLGAWVDSGPTDVSGLPRALRPVVPPPGAPNVEISQSLLLFESEDAKTTVHRAKRSPVEKRAPRRRHHVPQEGPGPAALTAVLPALARKERRSSSEWPLIAGLVVLALLIAGVVGAFAYLAVRTPSLARPVQTDL